MIELEDSHEDILSKAMRGLGIGKNAIAIRAGLKKQLIEKILKGAVCESSICLMARELDLDPKKLLISSRRAWHPKGRRVSSFMNFNLPCGDMTVNVYLFWDEQSRKAWLFDAGPDSDRIIKFVREKNLSISSIFLTHTHWDHIACLDELISKTGNPEVFVHESEPISNVNLIQENFESKLGSLTLRSCHTHGHSIGGITYVIDGLDNDKKGAIVGDALFAGSMGGGIISYTDALRTNREKIMSLPDETILFPGHGPMTTVGEEKKHNPFFPEF